MDGADAHDAGALPRWVWLGLAPLLPLLVVALQITPPEGYQGWLHSEQGLIELTTVAVLLVGIGLGIAALRLRERLPGPVARTWVLMVTLGCVYFAGEEVSWGQHLLGWSTPETFAELNDQNETNLHNISHWLDQKPRLLLELWVLMGGVGLPLLERLRRRRRDFSRDQRAWFWPPAVCFPVSLLTILVGIPKRTRKAFGLDLPVQIQYSETQELCFGVLLALFLGATWYRLRQSAQPRP